MVCKLEGGPVIDMGPYYITALVNLLGPAKKVSGRIINGPKYRTIGIGPKKVENLKLIAQQLIYLQSPLKIKQ